MSTPPAPFLVSMDHRPLWSWPESVLADALERHVALGNAVRLSSTLVVHPGDGLSPDARFVLYDGSDDSSEPHATLLGALASGLQRQAVEAGTEACLFVPEESPF